MVIHINLLLFCWRCLSVCCHYIPLCLGTRQLTAVVVFAALLMSHETLEWWRVRASIES